MKTFFALLGAIASFGTFWSRAVSALPPSEEVPEEVLRAEIILEARSPLTGEPLTVAEYVQLQEQLAQNDQPLLNTEIRRTIFLLQLRRVLRPVIPFLP